MRRSQVPRGIDLEGYGILGKDAEGDNPTKLRIYLDNTSLLDLQRDFDVERRSGPAYDSSKDRVLREFLCAAL